MATVDKTNPRSECPPASPKIGDNLHTIHVDAARTKGVDTRNKSAHDDSATDLGPLPNLDGHRLLVGAGALVGDPVDLRLGARIVAQKALEIGGTQYQHPAIPECHDIGLAPPSA